MMATNARAIAAQRYLDFLDSDMLSGSTSSCRGATIMTQANKRQSITTIEMISTVHTCSAGDLE